jgi:hypothetical protein
MFDQKFIIALIIIIIIFIIIMLIAHLNPKLKVLHSGYWMTNFVESPGEVLKRSNGTFDNAARLALNRVNTRIAAGGGNLEDDHALRANIIRHHILGHEHQYQIDENGRLTNLATRELNERRRHMEILRDDIRRITTLVNGIATTAFDNAIIFGYDGQNEIFMNDQFLQPQAMPELIQTANQRREQAITARQQIALETAAMDTPPSKTFLELSIQNTNDPQNVHDTSITATLGEIIKRLRADQKNMTLPSIDEIWKEIKENGEELSDKRLFKVRDVGEVISRIKSGEKIAVHNLTDEECLQRVWLRIDDPKNRDTKKQLRQAIFDALFDCWEEGIIGKHIVCVTGRITKVLSALTLLDWDEKNWEFKRLEQIKNDIFVKTAKVIEAEATIASKSDDLNIRNAGLSYLDFAITAAAENAATTAAAENNSTENDAAAAAAEEQLASKMKSAIREMILEHVAALGNNVVPPYMVDSIIFEAQAAVL